MPIVLRTKTQRLTNDQHRVEIAAVDLPVDKTLALSLDEEPLPAEGEATSTGLPHTFAIDVCVAYESKDVEDAGYSRKPDQILDDAPSEGMRTVIWRNFPLAEKHSFLMKRKKSGAYTVELHAEAHIRIITSGATETVTFPPTP